jgi:hypothetical protein
MSSVGKVKGTVITKEHDRRGEPIMYEGEIERADDFFLYVWWNCRTHGRERVLIPLDNVSSIHIPGEQPAPHRPRHPRRARAAPAIAPMRRPDRTVAAGIE